MQKQNTLEENSSDTDNLDSEQSKSPSVKNAKTILNTRKAVTGKGSTAISSNNSKAQSTERRSRMSYIVRENEKKNYES